MFTGIIETLGRVTHLRREESNLHLTIASPISDELKIDQSVAHNGVCLTVIAVENGTHTVTAIAETLQKTNLGQLQTGHELNLERCLAANGRFDGHVVQGHVDVTGICTAAEETAGSWLYRFSFPEEHSALVVQKGSVCVNGVSLTVVEAGRGTFSVAIIPYTHAHTTFKHLVPGSTVNLEFDVIGKYVARMLGSRLP